MAEKQLTDLFGKTKGTISKHVKHIFEDGELTKARLFGFSEQPPLTENSMKLRTAIWSWRWAFRYSPVAVRCRRFHWHRFHLPA